MAAAELAAAELAAAGMVSARLVEKKLAATRPADFGLDNCICSLAAAGLDKWGL